MLSNTEEPVVSYNGDFGLCFDAAPCRSYTLRMILERLLRFREAEEEEKLTDMMDAQPLNLNWQLNSSK